MCNLAEFDRDDLTRELSLYPADSPEYREIANAISTRDAIAYAIDHTTSQWAEIRPQHVQEGTDMTTTTNTAPFVLGAGYGVGITPVHTIDAVIDTAYTAVRDASNSTTVTLEYRQARKPVGATVTVTYAPENYGVPGRSWLSVDTNSVDGYRYIATATHRRINNGICAMLAIHAIEHRERADVLADNSAAPGTDAIGAGTTPEEFTCRGCERPEQECSTSPCGDVILDRLYGDDFPGPVGAGYGVGIASIPAPERDAYADVRVCESFGRAVGQAYTALPTRDDSQRVTDAYDAFRREIMQQYEQLPVRVTVVDTDPYATAADMFADVRTGRLSVLSSEVTGGHPYLTNDENNAFRAVHDFHGHYMSGRDFSRHGEDAAYLRHSLMFTRQACRALTMETRGQNSAFIFEHGGREFPEQKLGLLPRWCETRKPHVFGALWNSAGTGATVDQTGQTPTAGYAVAYGPGIVVRESEFTPDILAEFLRVEYAPFYGLWRHEEHVFLDTVLVVGDEPTARVMARRFDQIAFHDIATATDLYV